MAFPMPPLRGQPILEDCGELMISFSFPQHHLEGEAGGEEPSCVGSIPRRSTRFVASTVDLSMALTRHSLAL
jgi:hypothetical protein